MKKLKVNRQKYRLSTDELIKSNRNLEQDYKSVFIMLAFFVLISSFATFMYNDIIYVIGFSPLIIYLCLSYFEYRIEFINNNLIIELRLGRNDKK